MIALDVVDRATGKLAAKELPLGGGILDCTFDVETLPGANALHVLLREGGEVALSAAIPCDEETFPVTVRIDAQRRYQVDAPRRDVIYLPRTPEPAGTFFQAAGKKKVEFVFLVDGTMLAPDAAAGAALRGVSPLLGTQQWEEFAGQLAAVGEEIRKLYPEGARSTVVAFGDVPMQPGSESGYMLFPVDFELRRLREFRRESAMASLRTLPAASGGDFVDALGEGLAACREAGWRDDARKVVILAGDSVVDSYDSGKQEARLLDLADARVRDADVFEEAEALHAMGVEILSIYNTAPLEMIEMGRPELLTYARKQYVRLATKPEWMWSIEALDPVEIASTWHAEAGVFGSGACPGFWVE
jgi:hypothetical protein